MESLKLCLSRHIITSPLYLNNNFREYSMSRLRALSLTTSELSLHCLLVSIVSVQTEQKLWNGM